MRGSAKRRAERGGAVVPLARRSGRAAPAAKPETTGETRGPQLTAVVDGKQVVIEAEDEIVLRCGEASITLRRNGRVVIRGTYVETRARGVNRIKGGSVQIN